MGNPTDPRPIRLPQKTDFLVRQYAKKKGLGINQAIIHLLSKGLSIDKWEEEFHVGEFTENFFEKQ